VHEALRMTPAKAIGVASRTWSIAELVEAALTGKIDWEQLAPMKEAAS
jgi:hypothetical protein